MRRIGFVLFVIMGIFAGPVATHAQERERDSVEVYLRTLNAKFVAYVKRMAADSVATAEEMRNLIEGIEWFRDEKEEADSALVQRGEQVTNVDMVPGLFAAASSYRIPFARHRDTDAGVVQHTLARISGMPIRSVEDDTQEGSVILIVLAGILCAALFVYGMYRNRVRYSLLATVLGVAVFLLIDGKW